MPAPRNELKSALLAGETRLGLWVTFAHPVAAEIVSRAGYDWMLLDGEHAPNDIPLLLAQLQASAAGGTPVVTRVPVGRPEELKKVLDLGIQNVLVPMVDTAGEAAEMARAMRYPPEGIRGVGAAMARATNYGQEQDYLANANDEVCLMVQAESVTAIDNIDAIAATEGVDCVFVGPADLAATMGFRGKSGAPEVQTAIAHAGERIRAAGKAAGIVAFDTAQIRSYVAMGFNFVGVGGDISLFGRAVRDCLTEARALIE
jgi:4-hydroxy-2-oxoheptanedioate aldolase